MKRALLVTAWTAAVAIACTPAVSATPQEPDDPGSTIAVIGSSVASGWVTSREARQDLENGWAQRLGRLLAPRGYALKNVSVPGDDTSAVLERIEDDLLPLEPRFAIVGLSMSNEGLETGDPEAIYASYEEGLTEILWICREEGIQPIVGLCYPNDNYGEEQYATLERMNLAIQAWDVPSIDFLGPLDDGHGNFVRGYTFDLDHPEDRGHREMFCAVVPSLFAALEAGKPRPVWPGAEGEAVVESPGDRAPIQFVPGDVMHSFTMSFALRTSSRGTVAALDCGEVDPAIEIDGEGRPRLVCGGEEISGEKRVDDGAWHQVILTHRHASGECELWVNGASLGKLESRLVPRRFVLGGPAGLGGDPAPERAAYRDFTIHRTALSARAAGALHAGSLLQASLEVCAPLRSPLPAAGGELENRAQSLSIVRAWPGDGSEELARIEARIARADAEPRWIDSDPREAIAVDPAKLERCVGRYEVDAGMTFFVTLEKGRLIVSPNGEGKTELHPLSETEFFLRVMGPPEIPVVFVVGEDGGIEEMLFDEGPYQARGRRVD